MKTGLTNCQEREEALRLGNKFYTPPKPCRNGHASQRYSNSGVCVECATIKNAPRPELASEIANSIQTMVYVIEAGEFVKVGIAEDVGSRLQVLRTHCPLEANLVYCTKPLPRPVAKKIEGWCAFVLAEYSVRGEWYSCRSERAIEAIKQIGIDEAPKVVQEAVQLRLVS